MKRFVPNGFLIIVEGIDGAGKTSVATALAQYCGENGLACTFSKEPTSRKFGQELRRSAAAGRLSLEDEFQLFLHDREDHSQVSIRPSLQENSIVILDRYYWSSAAYQGSRGLSVEHILQENESRFAHPDLVLLLDLPVELGLARIRARGDVPNDFERADALQRCRDIFLDLAERYPQQTVKIDASATMRDVQRAALLAMKRGILAALIERQASRFVQAEIADLFDV
jgi:dTMP kinase